MKRFSPLRLMAIVFGVIALVCTAGCESAQEKAEQEKRASAAQRDALAHVCGLTKAMPENHAFWRTADEFFFGPGVLGVATTRPAGSMIDVDIEIWCTGRDAIGVPARLSRMVTVTMQQGADRWNAMNCSVTSERELGLFDPPNAWFGRMCAYFAVGLGIPLVMLCNIWMVSWSETLSKLVLGLAALSCWAATMASPLFAGYYAYWLTGSVLGTLVGVVASLPIAGVILRVLAALASTNSR
jgi:hypothetical protein